MKSFDVVSLDLFNTLVYIDRRSFDLRSHMEKSLLQFPELQQKIPQVSLDDIISDYYTIMREKFNNKETEKEFRNDKLLFEVLKKYTKLSPDLSILATKIIKFYFELALPIIHPFPGLIDTLDYLKEKKYTLVLTSNHSWAQNGWDILSKLSLENNYFERIIFSGDLGWRKPSPRIFSAATAGLKYRSKKHIIHVGDEIVTDIKGALDFGIKALWVSSSQDPLKKEKIKEFNVHKIISDISELPQIL
ncbi:MAG: HAD family hydrolase [Promethearchaeota archaeon]